MRKHKHEQEGRAAEKSDVSRKDWKNVLKGTRKEIKADNMSLVAAGVAFYLMLGIVPALIALISIYGLIADPQQIEQHFAQVSGVLPGAVTDILSQQMKRIASDSQTAGWGAALGILVALWSASSATKKLIIGLNIAYDEEEKRGFFKLTFVTLLLTLGAVLTGLAAVTAIVALPAILESIGIDNEWIAQLIRWPSLLAIALLGLAVLYRFGPSRAKPRWQWVSPGALLAMALWLAGSAAFSFYVSNFGKYNETYGSLAAIVIMLFWLYLSAYAVLVGAELNAEVERQAARDATQEPARGRGERRTPASGDLGEAYA